MTNPLYRIEQLPTTSAAALREFDDRYLAALGAAEPTGWVDRLGALVPTAAPVVDFPVSQLRTKYERTQGEGRAKTFGEASFEINSEEFDDGYEASLLHIFQQVFAYRQWQLAPARLVQAEARFRHKQIALMLEAGESTPYLPKHLKGGAAKNFFSATHPANIFDDEPGTFSNYQSVGTDVVSIANLETEVTAMMQVKDENGDFMGVMPDTILAPIQKAEPLKNLLKQAMIADPVAGNAGVTNPYMNGFSVEVIPEFTDADDWYLVDSKLVGELAPFLSLRMTVPGELSLRRFDEASDFFKKTGRLRVESHIWYGFSLGLPHAIRKIKGA
jgi:hypothetical protein